MILIVLSLTGFSVAVERLAIEPFDYETRIHGTIAAELGRLVVAECRSREESAELEIVFVRLAAQDGAAGPPIVYLAGGPGGSGIRAGQGGRYRLFDALRSSGDVILLDQRGTGVTTPCGVVLSPRRRIRGPAARPYEPPPASAKSRSSSVNQLKTSRMRSRSSSWVSSPSSAMTKRCPSGATSYWFTPS